MQVPANFLLLPTPPLAPGRFSKSPVHGRTGHGSGAGKPDDRPVKIKVQGRDQLFYGKELIDLRYVEQLADEEQTKALGYFLAWLCQNADGSSLSQQIKRLLFPRRKRRLWLSLPWKLSSLWQLLPRIQEVFACCNRFRGLSL